MRMPFWESVSTSTRARTTTRSARVALDVLQLDLDRVRDLLERAPQHLLAHELGQAHVLGEVGALGGREQERPLGHQRRQVLGQRPHAGAAPRGDGEDVVGDLELVGGGR